MAYRGRYPRITWGAAFANTLELASPLERALNYPRPREGSEFTDAPSGSWDSWIVGTDHLLEGVVRWIPATDMTAPFVATGWNGATGWRAFLEWAWQGNAFRWIYDRTAPGTYVTVFLVEPRPDLELALEVGGRFRSFRLVMRAATDAAIEGY